MARHNSFSSFPSILQPGGGNLSQDSPHCQGGSVAGGMCDEKTVEYLRDLIAEKQLLEEHIANAATNNRNFQGDNNEPNTNATENSSSTSSSHATNNVNNNGATKTIAQRLLDQEIARIQRGGKPPGRDTRIVDIYHEKPIRLSVRVIVPVKEHPKFNFVGKLLGPKGNSMKRLQEDTMTKMAVLGKGSMRNKQQEEELRNSNDPKHQHLQEDLHVEITAFAPPSEAHARIAYALTEVRKYLIPDANDEIRQEQMREMEIMAKRSSSPSPGSFSGCTVTSASGNTHSLHEGGNGGDDSPSSHDSGLGGNTSGSCLGSTTSNNEERSIIVEGVNGNPRTDSSTPPSHMNNEIDPSQNLIEDSQEIYKQIQSQRMNTSSPLSCPSSPLSSTTAKIHSTVSLFNNSSMTDSSSRSMPVQNSHACQTVHTSDWPTNVSGNSRNSGSGGSKYSRGCSQKVSPIRSSGLTVTGVPGVSSGRNRVYSILDKIRIANKERYSHHHAHPNQDNVVNNIKSLNNRSLTMDDLGRSNISAGSSEVPLGSRAYKVSSVDRGYYRTQISPYARPK